MHEGRSFLFLLITFKFYINSFVIPHFLFSFLFSAYPLLISLYIFVCFLQVFSYIQMNYYTIFSSKSDELFFLSFFCFAFTFSSSTFTFSFIITILITLLSLFLNICLFSLLPTYYILFYLLLFYFSSTFWLITHNLQILNSNFLFRKDPLLALKI